MATSNLSPFLSDRAEEPDQADILKAWDRAVIASRIIKTGILFVTAAAIVFAVLSAGNPLVLFANVTASLVGTSAPEDGTDQLAPTIQSAADAQVLPPTARDALKGDEIAAALEVADQSQTEIRQPPAEDLLNQFQSWAAEKDARAQVETVQPVAPVQPAEDSRTQVVQEARAQVRHVQKHRQLRPVQNARAEVRPEQNARAKVRPLKNARAQLRREQNARVQVPVQNAQAPDRSVQNSQAPGPLQSFGRLN
jgi:hypothetical protein